MKRSVVIVAGGKGSRMKSETPKQFLNLGSSPVLIHTIMRFYDYDPSIGIVVVLPFEHIETWNHLCTQHRFSIAHQVVAGGETRFYSVRNGLDRALFADLVAIHDGVRPMVITQLIANSFDAAAEYGSAIPVVPPSESLRKIENDGSHPVERSKHVLVQTPQTFNAKLIAEAYQQDYQARFTDDATVFEAAGHPVHLIDGVAQNIKITTPFDLFMAERFLEFETAVE